ncbi:TlyA family RNA methyltransferase [Amnibacterium setariae]|uniref:TlyA family RNA methyltransferase n=1 Tax=Amnibacterium setariae TaxID=2306585 RepID=A0A3A1U112_9MICO|nr:TlyA family RNA methyltransferase [Amnibacterium setariae]RIX27507.1 TlyA family RNA methyltransferase [Amnibacterium setariae]
MTAERLDVALVERGLARSRSAAQTAIASARVRVDGVVATRPAQRVAADAVVEVDAGTGWVGRGAGKLDAALDAFGIDASGRLALDLGASTGGFTQVLLERGAARVVALDVGHDQLVPELRADPRVVVVEGENARLLTPGRLAELTGSAAAPGLVVADLSFISLTLVLPAIAAVAAPDADLVLLVKPQFEVGRSRVRGGIVHDAADRATAVRAVLDTASAAGLRTAGIVASPVPGTHGNREALVHLHRLRGSDPSEWSASIERAVRSGGGEVG